jgi:hypothetical protein
MEPTAHTRRIVRTAVTCAVVAAGAALVAGGVAAARTVHAGAPAATPTGGPISVLAALPDGVGASNRAW